MDKAESVREAVNFMRKIHVGDEVIVEMHEYRFSIYIQQKNKANNSILQNILMATSKFHVSLHTYTYYYV